MKAFYHVSLFLVLLPSFSWGRMQAVLTVQNRQFTCESFQIDNVFQFYTPDVILLNTGISYNASLVFEFIHQGQIINHLNYDNYQLNLELDYPKQLLDIPAFILEENQLQLSLRINNIEAQNNLFIHITNDLGETLATFHFPIELSKDRFLASKGYDDVNTYNAGDLKVAFADAPFYIHSYNLQTKEQENYSSNSNLRIALKEGYDYLITFSVDLSNVEFNNSINQLRVVTEWVGMGLMNKGSQEQGFRFYIRGAENAQFNERKEKTVFRNSSEFWNPFSFWSINNNPQYNLNNSSNINDIYTMQTFILNEQTNEINAKTIDFYILK